MRYRVTRRQGRLCGPHVRGLPMGRIRACRPCTVVSPMHLTGSTTMLIRRKRAPPEGAEARCLLATPLDTAPRAAQGLAVVLPHTAAGRVKRPRGGAPIPCRLAAG